MKKLKELKVVHNVFVDAINDLDTKLQIQLKRVKQEYQKNVLDEKIRLLINVCNGEGLDFDKIKGKYLKQKELSQVMEDDIFTESQSFEEDLLDKVEINGEQYYYEPKEKGIIYDMSSNPVGIYKSGKFIFN